MKKLTKIITVLLAVVIITSACVVSFAANGMNIKAGNVTAKAGEEVTVNVNLNDNSGVAILRVTVKYDSSVLTLKKSIKGDAAKSFDSSMVSTSDNPIVLSCQMNPPEDEANADEANNKTNGNLLSLTFAVATDAKAGEYPITVNVVKCFDINDNNVSCSTESAKVVVAEKETTTEPTTPVVTTTTKPADNNTTTTKPADNNTTTTKPAESNTTTTKPAESNTTTTKPVDNNTTTKSHTGIPVTGDSSMGAVIAGVCVLAGVAFVATKKKEK